METLAPFTTADFEELIGWIDNEELLINWSGSLFKYPLTKESLDWYISDTNVAGSSDAFVYKAVDAAGNMTGHISLGGISWKNRSARISRVFVSEAGRNKGTCCRMISSVLKIGFEELGLHRIGLGVYSHNVAAIRCYEKCGMKIEGVQQDVLLHGGNWWSMVEMAILEDDWRKNALENCSAH